MLINAQEYVRHTVMELKQKVDNNETGKVMCICHYNSLTILKEEIIGLQDILLDYNIIYHHFDTSEVINAYEPFLNVIKEFVNNSNTNIEELMEKCNIYRLHRRVIGEYFRGKTVARDEEYIGNEIEFENRRMCEGIVNMLCYFAKEKPIIFILNKLHRCGVSTIEVIKEIIKSDCENIGVLFTYNDFVNISEYMRTDWNEILKKIRKADNVREWGFNTPVGEENKSTPFIFHSGRMLYYLESLENMMNLVALKQANEFATILHNKILLNELDVSPNNKLTFYEMFANIAIYSGDMTNALIACDSYEKLMQLYPSTAKKYKYYYLMTNLYIYRGDTRVATQYAEKCLCAARENGNEYMKFKAHMLEHMAIYSGWNDIWICDKSYGVNKKLISESEKYGYLNHLAHIYIYALDYNPELYSTIDGIEERLVNFNKGIGIAKKIDNSELIKRAYRKNLMIASTNGYFDVSRYYVVEKLQPIVQKEKDYFEQGNIYNDLGYNSCAVEKYEESHGYFVKALKIFTDLEKVEYVGETLYNMAINGIMALDYESAREYLAIVIRIIKTFHMENIRVAHVSKIFGLMAFCQYKLNNIYESLVNFNFSEQFLRHIIEKKDKTAGILYWDDDLFLYHLCKGLLASAEEKYAEAEYEMKMAYKYGGPEKGGGAFYYVIYAEEISKLYRTVGRIKDAETELKKCYDFYVARDSHYRADRIQEALKGEDNCQTLGYKLISIPENVRHKLERILVKAESDFEMASLEAKFKYINTWQSVQNVEYVRVDKMIESSMISLMNEFGLDKAIMVIKEDDGKLNLVFNNIGAKINKEKIDKLYHYFDKHANAFVASKLNKNFFDYEKIANVFDESHLCAIMGIPLYKGEKMQAFIYAYILMSDNWGAEANRIFISEHECKFFEFLAKQLMNAVEKLETSRKIEKQNEELSRLNSELGIQAVTDQLTQLYNRQGYLKYMKELVNTRRMLDERIRLSIIYCDLDKFKLCNDTYGHAAGDAVLKSFAKLLNDVCRGGGKAIRYGGDEFVLILNGLNRNLTRNIVDNIYETLAATRGFSEEISKAVGENVVIEKSNQVSTSIGVVFVDVEADIEAINAEMVKADKALYYAKEHGKGQCCYYDEIKF
jgi:diguanylate cyclase (GGDEF)-like protein